MKPGDPRPERPGAASPHDPAAQASARAPSIELLTPEAAAAALPGLASLLHACVHAGASVGFVLPHPLAEAVAFWRDRVLPGVAAGRTLLFVARATDVAVAHANRESLHPEEQPARAASRRASLAPTLPLRPEEDRAGDPSRRAPPNDGLLGCVVLGLDALPNGAHRGEVAKLLVHPAARRLGLARALMAALHAEAARRGRSLLTLDTRTGDAAEPLYRALGYRVSGTIPHFCRHPVDGTLESTTVMFREL